MGSLATTPPFQVLDDTRPDDKSLPAFMVSTTRGFLPRMDPVVSLPAEFDALESILQRMPVKTASGEPGLLALGKLGDEVDGSFPDLTAAMDRYEDDLPVMNALYRDYSFLASAYLLEPCHERFVRGEGYGLGRQRLPRNISQPIARCAEICGFKPFMEYAGSYALFNYRLVDPAAGLEYSNLRLIRAFEHGLDPESSEAGFVLVHIDMVKNSGPLVAGTMQCLEVASRASSGLGSVEERTALNQGLRRILDAMTSINGVMETMWGKSRPTEYTSFRTFIFGITSQSMFPDGVVYEGLNDDQPLSFRGESGANDSMVPLMDNLLQVPMPSTPLTEILKDFRQYRPSNHKAFLQHVRDRSMEVELRAFTLGLKQDGQEGSGDEEKRELLRQSRGLWLQILNQVRDFRWRHWCFAREYILKRTAHPTATGGSPIVTWLPNQLEAVLADMADINDVARRDDARGLGRTCDDVMEAAMRQRETLRKEVDKYCAERGVARG
ncbi:indoleamine 2,3-dioxygenase [Hirsutella rhossiliensis]|uniref:Indoleamine 2,3-dioxygenase domain-containing protein n=1 Tax=Hirsutella rhossiliensis TaxID=111463 RepID=A0A9P8MUJ7_9HYPO|nr:indoleamine 2,3-dioxygenase domain-containing protein [Hirsutella rhossiliensis]KAH0959472.1 indoleamine 2,3-dioxygenase domain-containing protein [Hirsutella rhossiliensis]